MKITRNHRFQHSAHDLYEPGVVLELWDGELVLCAGRNERRPEDSKMIFVDLETGYVIDVHDDMRARAVAAELLIPESD